MSDSSFAPEPDARDATGDAPGGPRRLALVTGASSGIGRAFAERLARDAWDLVLVARRRDRLEELAAELRRRGEGRVEVLAADLGDGSGVRAVEERIEKAPTLDLLVNNAGFGTSGPFAELDRDAEEGEIRLNVLALVRLTHAALAAFGARRHGSIVNVSSLAGFQPAPYTATYAATKAFVNSFTQALAEELRGSGIRLQLLCPGFTRTEFQDVAGVRTETIPGFAWMEPAAVVDASLEGLRRGTLVVVPGSGNKVLGSVIRALPAAVVRRAGGILLRRSLGG
jgi:hypothetical protein